MEVHLVVDDAVIRRWLLRARATVLVASTCVLSAVAFAAPVTHTFAPGTTISSAQVNQNFTDLSDQIDDLATQTHFKMFLSSTPTIQASTFTAMNWTGTQDRAGTVTGATFQPDLPGIYELKAQIASDDWNGAAALVQLVKTAGAAGFNSPVTKAGDFGGNGHIHVSWTVRANGTTDAFEIRVNPNGASSNVTLDAQSDKTWFTGVRVGM